LEPLIVILGPTATGKTGISLEIAKKVGGEIISGDSMQVYRGMDIGTAKIKHEEAKGIPHYLIDIKNPDDSFSVAEFQKLARERIQYITNKRKIPMLVGGTGLYIHSVIDPYKFMEKDLTQESNKPYRQELLKLAEEHGKEYLHKILSDVDAKAAERIHPNDLKRVTRALEYFHSTGKQISKNRDATLDNTSIINRNESGSLYNTVLIGLTMERSLLYQRIEQRVDKMMEDGLLDEVKNLLGQGYSPKLCSMQGVGYKQLIGHLEGEYTLEEAVTLIKRDTRHFAKRQLTWFKRDLRINWFEVDKYNSCDENLLLDILTIIGRNIDSNVE